MSACDKWFENKLVNPYTGRSIKPEGHTYTILARLCDQPLDCSEWRENKLVNPVSRRPIKLYGATYNMIRDFCGDKKPLFAPYDYDLDEYNLYRFVEAQDRVNDRAFASNYEVALSELLSGKKTSRWIGYIFPQFKGSGTSATSKYLEIRSADEAHAYLHHPILGPRYIDCLTVILSLTDKTARQIFSNDDAKVMSSLTLFYYVAPKNFEIQRALREYFYWNLDKTTIAKIIAAG